MINYNSTVHTSSSEPTHLEALPLFCERGLCDSRPELSFALMSAFPSAIYSLLWSTRNKEEETQLQAGRNRFTNLFKMKMHKWILPFCKSTTWDCEREEQLTIRSVSVSMLWLYWFGMFSVYSRCHLFTHATLHR